METTTKRSEAGHTPGPWEWERSDDEDGHVIRMGKAITDRGMFPAEEIVRYEHGLYPDEETEKCREQYARAEANAALIASAPTMRATLDATAGSLAEIEACFPVIEERIRLGQTLDALKSLALLREAVASLAVNVKEG